jgi:hypothetical protein
MATVANGCAFLHFRAGQFHICRTEYNYISLNAMARILLWNNFLDSYAWIFTQPASHLIPVGIVDVHDFNRSYYPECGFTHPASHFHRQDNKDRFDPHQ